jgi:hypothetical protein
MTRDEWQAVSHVAFAEWWGAPQDLEQCESWYGVLRGFNLTDVEHALQRLLRITPHFAPRLGELLGQLEPRLPTFDTAWFVLYRLLARHGAEERKRGLQAIADDPALGPEVAGWAAAYGWRRLCLAPVGDPEHGGAELHHLRQDFVASVRQENLPQLAAALTRELERSDREQIGAADPKRLDPMQHVRPAS